MSSRVYSTVVVSSQTINSSYIDAQIRQKADQFYFKLVSQELSETEMQVEFAKEVLSMIIASIPADEMSSIYMGQVDDLLKENMGFLRSVYPKIKESKIRPDFLRKFRDLKANDRVEFDLLTNLSFEYHIKKKQLKRRQILQQTEQLLNRLIKLSNETLPAFNHLINSKIANEMSWRMRTQYLQTLKDCEKFQIETMLLTTKQYDKELVHENLGFSSADVYVAVSKWVESLALMVERPDEYLKKRNYLKIKYGSQQENILNPVKSLKIFGRSRNKNYNDNDGSGNWNLNLFGDQDEDANQSTVQIRSETSPKQSQGFLQYFFNGFRQLCQEKNTVPGLEQIDQNTRTKFSDRSSTLWSHNSKSGRTSKRSKLRTTGNGLAGQSTRKFQNFEFKKSGYPLAAYSESLAQLGRDKGYCQFLERQRMNLRNCCAQNVKIVQKNKIKQKYTENEKKVYSFSKTTYQILEQMLINQLVFLIQAILSFQQAAKQEDTKSTVFRNVQLLTMAMPQIFSLSLVGDENFIEQLYRVMLQLNSTGQISIMGVENRLQSSHRDVFIQFRTANSPIPCSVSLILEYKQASRETKQVASEMMHHFFERIESAPYGALAFLSALVATSDHRVQYLNQIKPLQVTTNTPLNRLCHCGRGVIAEDSALNLFADKIVEIITEDRRVKIQVYKSLIPDTFICGICQKISKKGTNILPTDKCTDCNFSICVHCAYQIYPEQQKLIYLHFLSAVAQLEDQESSVNFVMQNPKKMSSSHCYTKEVQVLNKKCVAKKTECHYDIVVEGRNMVKYGDENAQEFWKRVRENIELKRLANYQSLIQNQEYIGIILRPNKLLRKKGLPLIFITYDSVQKQFSKLTTSPGSRHPRKSAIDIESINVSRNDMFFPILCPNAENSILEFIQKLFDTSPFCQKKYMRLRDSPSYQQAQEIQQISSNSSRHQMSSNGHNLVYKSPSRVRMNSSSRLSSSRFIR